MDTRLLSQLPTEQARCREVARQFNAMGSIGCFAAALIEQALRRADRAIIEGGEAEIRCALDELQAFEMPATACGRPLPATSVSPVPPTRLRLASSMPPVGRRPVPQWRAIAA